MDHEPNEPEQRIARRRQYDQAKKDMWSLFGGGIFCVAVGIGLWFLFDHAEKQGQGFRIWWLIALLYNWFGKWGTAWIFIGLGGLFLLGGVFNLFHVLNVDKMDMAEPYEGETERRCAKCGQLCPEYHAKCKNCGFEMGREPVKEDKPMGNEGGCPSCGFGYKWDGKTCGHCGHVASSL